MAIQTKTLKFNNTKFSFVFFDGSWIISAKLLGLALGYAKEGQKLADAITGGWNKKWTAEDYKVLSGAKLKTLREETRQQAPDFSVSPLNSLLVLTPSGVVKVLQRSRAGLAQEFRNFISKEAIFKNYIGSLEAPKQMDLSLKENEAESSNSLGDTMKVIEVMSKKGLMTKKEQKLALSRILDIKMTALSRENKVTHFFNPDGTVDPTKLPAMSSHALAVQEGSVQLIERGQRHPDYQDWQTAHDIGAVYGLKADLVKKYIKAYVLALHSDLPNNMADDFVERSGGKFPPPDKHGFLVSRDVEKTVGGIAIYSKIDGNKLVWRNYWSPSAVKVINGLIESDRNIKPRDTVTDAILKKAEQSGPDYDATEVRETVEDGGLRALEETTNIGRTSDEGRAEKAPASAVVIDAKAAKALEKLEPLMPKEANGQQG